jgi:hypothetical protein
VRSRMRVPTNYDFTASLIFMACGQLSHTNAIATPTTSSGICMARGFGHSLSISFSSSERILCLMAAYATTFSSGFPPMTYHFSSSDVLPTTAYACGVRHTVISVSY